ncbi:NAD-dependent epimerase/dehydratase family protein [Desmospora activa]|uniref:Dihydroflavonol-4-reductase n=1 Tax=Desmospora activa DSM 45169 TaxID=1121389 RepID=A0A2T4Z9B4_9BACL|nr:NAD-dependent epimerase/dehydratase family protein [Desmospora activa]PTM58489.1 dihydroflavonol-4-reductase [Desmospora activa DSM 45169]
MRVLVTGGTGFLGRHLVHALVERGHQVTVLYRSEKRLHHLPKDVQTIRGDVKDADSIQGCARGHEVVFHLAGEVAWGRRLRRRMLEGHLVGTRHLIAEAKRAEVARFILTSSAAAVGFSDDGTPLDEYAPFNGDRLNIGYAIAKRKAEEEVLREADAGFPGLCVNPSVIVGPRSPSFLSRVAQGRLRLAPAGGVNLVDVRDVVEGHLLAMEKGKPGTRTILAGTNLPLVDVFQQIQHLAGGEVNVRPLSRSYARLVAIVAEMASWINGRDAALAWDLATLTNRYAYYDATEAKQQWGWQARPLQETLSWALAQTGDNDKQARPR